jgi:hypothetical protein
MPSFYRLYSTFLQLGRIAGVGDVVRRVAE